MSATYGDTALRKFLEERLEAEVADRIKELSLGMAADWSDYRNRVGHIGGLSRAMELLEDTFTEMNGDPRMRGR